MSEWDGRGSAGLPPGSAWGVPAAAPLRIPHSYPLAVRDPSMSVAVGLVLRTLPYALMRFLVLLAVSVAVILWLVVMIGGAAWLGAHIAVVFGWIWAIGCLALAGFVWSTLLRYLLHLIECGHVAVLTELITKGQLPNAQEGQFAYGKRVVLARVGQETMLFGLNALVRGIVQSLHNTLDWLAEMLPIPGLEGVSRLIDIVLKGATRYLDKVIFSYTLARDEEDVWRSSREGLVYYAQDRAPDPEDDDMVLGAGAGPHGPAVPASARAGGRRDAGPAFERAGSGRGDDGGGGDPAGRATARRLRQADLHGDADRAFPFGYRGPADQSGVGRQAQRDFRPVPGFRRPGR